MISPALEQLPGVSDSHPPPCGWPGLRQFLPSVPGPRDPRDNQANSGSGYLGEISMSVNDTELRSAKCWIHPLHPEPRLVFRRI